MLPALMQAELQKICTVLIMMLSLQTKKQRTLSR